jgi:hypothetical protein
MKNCFALVLLVLLMVVPLFQIISVAATNSKTAIVGGKGFFHERDELRTLRNEKWLEWWVTILLRLIGIEPR